MLFFAKGEFKDVVNLSSEKFLELAVAEWETISKHKSQGKVLTGGALKDRKGGCGIFNVDSKQELDKLLSGLPMFPFLEWVIIPLDTIEDALNSAKKALTEHRSL